MHGQRDPVVVGQLQGVELTIEGLDEDSEEFGLIQLWKIASRIVDDEGQLAGWSIALSGRLEWATDRNYLRGRQLC